MQIARRFFTPDTIALRRLPGDATTVAATPQPAADPVIVVGGGPSGLRVAQETSRRGLPVILFNAERWQPYNRVRLTPFLAGEVQIGRVYQHDAFGADAPFTRYDGHTVVRIDVAARTVENQFGRRWRYAKLVLCLGSSPHIPPIPGRDLAGVYTFRNFDDVERLLARALRSRRTIVVGGGLLGLEAARGMARRGVPTSVIEHENRPMARQLDEAAGRLLAAQIATMGLDLRTLCAVRRIDGEARVEAVVLSGGETLDCDTVIVCTGVRPNIDLARDAGIAVGRGIAVDDAMRTSAPDVYAVGECAEHDGHVCGLVAPGLEQAAVAAAHIAGEAARYGGSVPSTRLKVVGTDVFSMGDIEQLDQRIDLAAPAYSDDSRALYRRLAVRRFRLAGAIAVGPWPQAGRIQQAIRDRAFLWPWQIWRFRRSGNLFADGREQPVAQWPAAATVCNCTGVTRGQLGEAIAQGACSVEALSLKTSASSVCGSCRPLLQQLLGGKAAPEKAFGARGLAAAALLALPIALATLLAPHWPYSTSFEAGIGIDRLWTDPTTKQITGFSLLGLSALVAFMSLRKRAGWHWLGGYRVWRLLHALAGTLALGVLFLHTGFHLGVNLNRWLMLTFLAVTVAGAAAGLVTAIEHRLQARQIPSRRQALAWLHIFAFWPLPLLLFIHIVTVYAY